MTIVRHVTAELGPREIVLEGKIIAKVDNIILHVEEASEEELDMLKKKAVILLVKPLDFELKEETKGGEHESRNPD